MHLQQRASLNFQGVARTVDGDLMESGDECCTPGRTQAKRTGMPEVSGEGTASRL